MKNKYCLYYNKENNSIGIKFVKNTGKFIPTEGNPTPVFEKRKIFYLQILENNGVFDNWSVNIYNSNNDLIGDFVYSLLDYNNKEDKSTNIRYNN